MKREYPFTAWVLGGTFIPKPVELVDRRWGDDDWHQSSGSKTYHSTKLHDSKEDAILFAREKLEEQEAKIVKQQQSIAKKRANLDKHSD